MKKHFFILHYFEEDLLRLLIWLWGIGTVVVTSFYLAVYNPSLNYDEAVFSNPSVLYLEYLKKLPQNFLKGITPMRSFNEARASYSWGFSPGFYPPAYWIFSIPFIILFGPNELSLRLFATFSLGFSVVLAYELTVKLFNQYIALFTALTIPFFESALLYLRAQADIPILMIYLLTIFVAIKSRESKSKWGVFLTGFFLGMSFLIKQPNLLLIFPVGYILLTEEQLTEDFVQKIPKTKIQDFLISLAISFVVAFPWYFYVYILNIFSTKYLFAMLVNSANVRPYGPQWDDPRVWVFYGLTYSNQLGVLFSFLTLLGIFSSLSERSGKDRLLWIWILPVLLTFTLVKAKQFRYLIPIWPVILIFCGKGLMQVVWVTERLFLKIRAENPRNIIGNKGKYIIFFFLSLIVIGSSLSAITPHMESYRLAVPYEKPLSYIQVNSQDDKINILQANLANEFSHYGLAFYAFNIDKNRNVKIFSPDVAFPHLDNGNYSELSLLLKELNITWILIYLRVPEWKGADVKSYGVGVSFFEYIENVGGAEYEIKVRFHGEGTSNYSPSIAVIQFLG
ncbi:MAG: glycosyltransferase family 39 protein [Candidatus Heimdallarchaeota archaeon]